MKIEQDMFEQSKDKKSKNKIATIISILIVVTILVVIGIILLILHMQGQKLVVNINGQKVSVSEDTFLFVEGKKEVYVSIKDIASYVGYESHNRRI